MEADCMGCGSVVPNWIAQIHGAGVDAGSGWRYSLGRYRIWPPTPSRLADWPHSARLVPIRDACILSALKSILKFGGLATDTLLNNPITINCCRLSRAATEAVYSIEDRSGDYAQS
jgi:hypothetical protein